MRGEPTSLIIVCSLSVLVGIVHLLFPDFSRALWDFFFSLRDSLWEETGDWRQFDPTESHTYDASLLSYRLAGLGFIAMAGLLYYYAH